MDFLDRVLSDEAFRNEQFPVTRDSVFLSHAGVTVLPRAAVDAMREFLERSSRENQESAWAVARINETRELAAGLIGADASEIALLGPTSLGLSLIANGIDWREGDEVVGYFDDYPANVYPWRALQDDGVRYVGIAPDSPGEITWDILEPALSQKTRLVALASCHFVSGYRIDVDGIGRRLRERGILLCLDGIQTVGAFPTPVEHVDFLAADSHKWMLGPCGAGILYVRKELHDELKPSLLGSVNIESPDYVTQEDMRPVSGARRYESGVLNIPGIHGMYGSLSMLEAVGPERVAARLLHLRQALLDALEPLGYRPAFSPKSEDDSTRSAITTVTHPEENLESVFRLLGENGVVASLRRDRSGTAHLRFSPHFYNTEADIERVVEVLS